MKDNGKQPPSQLAGSSGTAPTGKERLRDMDTLLLRICRMLLIAAAWALSPLHRGVAETLTNANLHNAEDIQLFVLGGQSNMQGWQGNAEDYPANTNGIDQKIGFYWVTPGIGSSNGKWTYLRPQDGRFAKGHFGPEVTFARLLAGTGGNIAIFKYSLTATSLANNWKAPGQNGMYDRMIAELNAAVTQLREQGHKVSIKALVWVQGESDAQTQELADGYSNRLNLLINDFRKNVAKDASLPIVLGVDEQHPFVRAFPNIVKAQQELAQKGNNIISTSMIGLEKADYSHLSPKGLEDHGYRLFDAYMTLTRRTGARENILPSQSCCLSAGRPLRVLTMNIYNFAEPYAERMALLRQGIQELDPDLMAFQEAGFADGRHQVADVLKGMGYHILHQLEVKPNAPWNQGCCVASRWPIELVELLSLDLTEHTHSYPYAALAVRVAVPSPVGPLLFVNAKPSWELNREYERERQAVEIVKMVRRHASTRDFPPIVAGDFDATPDASSVRFLTGKQSLEGMSVCFRDACAEAGDGGPGYTWTVENQYARHLIETILFEKRHARRIDYIFMGSFHDYPKFARIATCRVALDRPSGGVWPSDHYAVYATIDVMASSP